MAKGQQRSNREKKKPKQSKQKPPGAVSQFSAMQAKPAGSPAGQEIIAPREVTFTSGGLAMPRPIAGFLKRFIKSATQPPHNRDGDSVSSSGFTQLVENLAKFE